MSTPTTHREAPDAEETRALQEAVRDACARYAGDGPARALLDSAPGTAPDPALWRVLTRDLGLGGLIVPEEYGGVDAGWPLLAVVLGELGGSLACTPFVPSAVLAAQLLLGSGDTDACGELLPAIADGSVVATVAVIERRTDWDDWAAIDAPARADVSARLDGTQWRVVSGQKQVVAFGASADLVLVVAVTDAGSAIFAVDGGADGMRATPRATLDATRPVADLVLADTPARLIGEPGAVTGAAVRRTLELGGLALAAEDVGAARHCLQLSVDYALLRTQFGRAIGSFQAIKHKLADMLVAVEVGDAAVEGACLIAEAGTAEAAVAAVVARASAAESLRLVAAETIQTHGGIGFTWEHPAHLYFRRAKTSLLSLGGPAATRERLLERLGLV